MTYCHISDQCARHAEQQARDEAKDDRINELAAEFIERVIKQYPWIGEESIEDDAYQFAKSTVEAGRQE